MHPWTSEAIGFRLYENGRFGELQPTNWCFDGTNTDVLNFVDSNICSAESIKRLSFRGQGVYDLLLKCGKEYRIYTTIGE